MMTRRTLLTLAAGGAVTLAGASVLPRSWLAHPAYAQSEGQASAFVKRTGTQLVDVVNGPGSTAEKRQRLQQVIDSTVDVAGIARFCLGRFWRRASPEQQRTYVGLFHEVLLNNIAGHLGEYQGVRFDMGDAQHRADGDHVSTTIMRPNNPPAQVDWVIDNVNGSPKVIDVIAEGTSLRLTQRSDYAAYLTRNGDNVQTLIDALRRRASG